ncbi:MAG: transcription elongation factor GreB [Bacteriovoracaceae bacterium]
MKIVKDNYITPKGHQILVDELNQLVLTERPEITKIIQWAAGNGDRSENADYIYGRRRLREIDRRSNFLRKRISKAVIIDPVEMTSNKIKFGATITVLDGDGSKKVYSIVGVDEINTKLNFISWKSPIGRSLLNKEIGDEVEIKIPSGLIELEVIEITYKKIY